MHRNQKATLTKRNRKAISHLTSPLQLIIQIQPSDQQVRRLAVPIHAPVAVLLRQVLTAQRKLFLHHIRLCNKSSQRTGQAIVKAFLIHVHTADVVRGGAVRAV